MAGLREPPAVQVILRAVDQSAWADWAAIKNTISTASSLIDFIRTSPALRTEQGTGALSNPALPGYPCRLIVCPLTKAYAQKYREVNTADYCRKARGFLFKEDHPRGKVVKLAEECNREKRPRRGDHLRHRRAWAADVTAKPPREVQRSSLGSIFPTAKTASTVSSNGIGLT